MNAPVITKMTKPHLFNGWRRHGWPSEIKIGGVNGVSLLTYIASDRPLKAVKNPHHTTLSVNEALAMGLDVPACMLKDEFDKNEPDVILWSDIELVIDTVHNTVDDGGHDDDFAIFPIEKTADFYTEKQFCACLEWSCTDARAAKVVEYIKEHLEKAREVEIWQMWLGGDLPPKIKNGNIPVSKLTIADIKALDAAKAWEEIPIHYCCTVFTD